MTTLFMQWFRPPVFKDDEDKTRSALLLNVVLNTFIIALPVVSLGSILGGNLPRLATILTIIACAWVLVFGIRFIMLAGHVALAGIGLITVIFTAVTLTLYNVGSIRAPATSFYILTIVMSGLIISRRAILWMAGISTITVIMLLLAETNGLLPPPNLTITLTQGTTFAVVFAIISVLLYLAVKNIDEALARARQELAERQRVEKEREKYIEKLDKQSAELERFTYTISHDLKSPVITIKGFLGMLKKDIQDNNQNKVDVDLKRISDAAEKMGTLLSELLELSRIGRVINPAEEVDLGILAHEAIGNLDFLIRSKKVKICVASNLPVVYGDHVRLREVYENLIDNSIKYMGGQTSPLIEIGARREKEVILFVKDNGTGINPIYHEKIFGLFEKLDAKSEGTGIGLALVKRIIETHSGRVWVESDGLGKGSTFFFTISSNKDA
ncbi:MAG: GHKL domain-containing protein [Anaerolineales bacterium]|nr:GHKL domain-containing protein [Anaerolineales bacterium]